MRCAQRRKRIASDEDSKSSLRPYSYSASALRSSRTWSHHLRVAVSQVRHRVEAAALKLGPRGAAESFERLREASDRLFAETGTRPKIFLANLGRIAEFNARATFAKNFFEAGGIEAVSNDGFATADGKTDLPALVSAFKSSGAKLACLCSSDKVEAVEAAKALAAAGATVDYLAGRPGDLEAALKEADVRNLPSSLAWWGSASSPSASCSMPCSGDRRDFSDASGSPVSVTKARSRVAASTVARNRTTAFRRGVRPVLRVKKASTGINP